MSEDHLVLPRPQHRRSTSLEQVVAWLVESGVEARLDGASVEVTGCSLSSRRIVAGDLYAALPGARHHGMDFVTEAVGTGAVAVLTDPAGAGRSRPADLPAVVVENPRDVLGLVAAGVYGHPAASMRMIGVTGTQGKTTVTRLAEGGLQAAGVRSAVIGTVGTRIDGNDVASVLTTPEAPDLHGLFAAMRERDVEVCAMEVSSHALVLGRVDGVVFDVAVFLNLGRDHLDFHADVEDYYRAKASLFTPGRARRALVDIDDEHGRRLAAEVADDGAVPVRTMSLRDPDADWSAVGLDLAADGSTFTVRGPGGVEVLARVCLPGDFNVANALAAIAAAAEAGFDAAVVADGIAVAGGVPGRLEQVDAGQDFAVVVDYAHKPDAVAAALRTLRPLTDGRVIVVLGAGGDRDPGKRPIMAGIAAELADVLVVTDDNPRTEDPAAIRAAMIAGTAGARAEVVEVGGRREAIRSAVRRAGTGDIVLIAGKGHETGQEIAGTVHPFDDRLVAREEISTRRAAEDRG